MRKISTIVATNNHREFIARALDGAICQKGEFSHEILVTNYGSTDGTADIVRDYAEKYPGLVRDVSTGTGQGFSVSLRHAFANATGEYIAILDGCDYWTDAHKLEKQLTFLERNVDCPMVFARIQFKDGETCVSLSGCDSFPEKLGVSDLLSCEWTGPICDFSCCLFRRKSIDSLPDAVYEHPLGGIAAAFFLVMLGPIGYMNEVLAVHCRHSQGWDSADDCDRSLQALRVSMIARKVAWPTCWGTLTEGIERVKRRLSAAMGAGKPRLSIVTITYNNRSGLEKTAESVAKQTWTDFEWIVIDGGSSDGTVDFLQQLGHPPDTFISEKDDGVYDAMNKGVNLAKGEYCICLNAGDSFREADTLKKAFSHEFSADVVYGDWARKYRDSETICHAPPDMPPFFFFMPECNICQQSMFVRTSLLQASNFDVKLKLYADWAKWRQLMVDGCSFQYIPLVVCDFEAGTGISEIMSPTMLQDMIRLQSEYPQGVITQAVRLRKYMDVNTARIAELSEQITACRTEAAMWKAKYDEMSTSTCWRMTKPIRWALDNLKAVLSKIH